MASAISFDLQGQGGGIVLGAADSYEGKIRWIQVINDAEIAGFISENITDDYKLVGVSLPAGIGFGGKFTFIELTSGVVIAYFE